jgi:hypothetical protein
MQTSIQRTRQQKACYGNRNANSENCRLSKQIRESFRRHPWKVEFQPEYRPANCEIGNSEVNKSHDVSRLSEQAENQYLIRNDTNNQESSIKTSFNAPRCFLLSPPAFAKHKKEQDTGNKIKTAQLEKKRNPATEPRAEKPRIFVDLNVTH